MTGYTRNDTANNIATGNIINAADLDGEFDAIQAAFNSSTGHDHDGTAGSGAPILTIGPAQDIVASNTALRPKTDDAVDLGTTSQKFRDAYIDGTAYMDAVDIDSGAIDGTTIGATVASTGAFTTLTSTGVTTLNGTSIPNAVTLVSTAATQTLTNKTLTSPTVNGGTINNATIGATTPNTGAFTTLSATGNVTLGDASTDNVTINGTINSPVVVSIGSASDALRVTQTGAGNVAVFEDAANPDSTPTVIDSAGRIINGHTAALTSIGAVSANDQQIGNSINTVSAAMFGYAGNLPQFHLVRSEGAIGVQSAVAMNNGLGQFRFGGSDGTSFIEAARIQTIVDGTVSTGIVPGRLDFLTADTAGSLQSRVRITPEGYLRLTSLSPGIQFNGVTSAANAFNNYETGSWIPVLTDGTNDATMSGTANNAGRYTRIGREVFIHGRLQITAIGAVTGPLLVKGLPFTTDASQFAQGHGVVTLASGLSLATASAVTMLTQASTTRIALYVADGTAGHSTLDASEVTSSLVLNFALNYIAA